VSQTAKNRKTPSLARRVELLGTIALHWKTSPVAHGRSIVPNRSELEGISAREDIAAGASGGAIGDNSSTLQDSAVLQKLIL